MVLSCKTWQNLLVNIKRMEKAQLVTQAKNKRAESGKMKEKSIKFAVV